MAADPVMISDAVNYKAVDGYAPRYRFRKIPLFNIASGSVLIPIGSTVQLQFKLGADVYNLSKSYLSYSVQLALTGAGVNNWLYADVPELANQIQLTDGGSFPVTTINYAQNYARLQRKLNTPLNEYIANDITSGLAPSNAALTGNAIYPTSTNVANINFTENAYALTSAAVSRSTYQRQYTLDVYKDSIFAMDRDLYFGRDMYINILAGPASKFGFTGTATANPTTGPAALTTTGTGPAIMNCYLYLAVEVNPILNESIKAKYNNGGLTMMIPFPYQSRLTTASGQANTAFSVNYQIQPSMGQSIQKIIYQPQDNSNGETINFAYDNSNVGSIDGSGLSTKITSYQTSIDSQPLQDIQLYCSRGDPVVGLNQSLDDWRENSKFCENTCILNSYIYQTNWFHQDCWVDCNGASTVPKENIVSGLPLNVSRTWAVNGIIGTTTASLSHYIYTIVQRELTISPITGIQFDVIKQAPGTTVAQTYVQ